MAVAARVAEPARPLMRVLLALPESTGGIGRHVAMLASGLAARGHVVTVAAPAATLTALRTAAADVTMAPVPLGTATSAGRAWSQLRRLVMRHDVVHAHGARVGAQAALVRPPLLVTTWHNAPLGGLGHRTLHGTLEHVSARRSNVVLAASSDLVARARSAGARAAKLCPVAAPHLTAPVGEPRNTRPTVLAVARLHPQKRLDLLIEAAAGWRDDPRRPQVLLAGDGPLRASLQAHAERLGAPVEFLGPVRDVPALLARADVVALPSDWEARPLVAQEALAAGVPLVVTAVGGVRELVGAAAVLVPPGDAAALRAALERVLGDPSLRQRLRRDGPAQAHTWPTAEQMVELVERTYLDLIATSSRQSP